MKKSKEKVIVGISGGVDSSVTAGILKRQGYDVVGVFMRLWKSIENKKEKLLLNEIKKIGETLNIPIRIVDVRKEFREKVVDYFLKEYAKGKTPNPCIFCNENLKFKILFQEMKKMKADYIATGHYVLTRKVKSHPPAVEAGKSKVESKEKFEYKLFEAKDKNKDQSYFLYRLKQEQLKKIIFPLGIYQKEDVRKLAKKFNLPNFEKKESQDICFLSGLKTEDFLKKNIKIRKGKIIDLEGNILGDHFGTVFYTIGQRKGINLGGKGPYYVVRKDVGKNNLIVTSKKEDLFLFFKFAKLNKVNFVSPKIIFPANILSKTRYGSKLVSSVIKRAEKKGECIIFFKKKQRAVTPGQSVVFYSEAGELLGGGIIN